VQGKWRAGIAAEGSDAIRINGQRLGFSEHATAADIPWGDLGVDLVLECTGKFLTPETIQGHLDRGAQRVIVAAPVKVGDVLNIVVGVNEHLYNPARDRIVTAASCTTNCLAPVVKVVHEAIGIKHGQITTLHNPTNTNLVVDAPHKDLRRARSAMVNLAPTTTGSATAIALIYPELKASTPRGACASAQRLMTDCVFELNRATTAESPTPCSKPPMARWPHPGLRISPVGERRLRPIPAVPSWTASDHGDRRHAAQGLRLVRQRDGLRHAHGGPGLLPRSPGHLKPCRPNPPHRSG
jgi:glyceraldehyde-3-phosphate dehydrogenase type I